MSRACATKIEAADKNKIFQRQPKTLTLEVLHTVCAALGRKLRT
jgi:hypothetical protein